MSELIFFDTETTGNTESDFLIQLAYKVDPVGGSGETFSGLYKPPKSIPPEASAVHHITNKMVADRPSLKDSGDLPKLKKVFEAEDAVAVAHNAPFDILMLSKEGIEPRKFICTLRLARHLDKEEKLERYNLQYLRYKLELEVEAQAHSASGDVLVLEALFNRLERGLMEREFGGQADDEKLIEKMIEISARPSLIRTFRFGKHIGKRVEEVAETDRGYLEWLLAQKLNGDGIDEDWIYTLKHYLKK